MPTRVHTGSDAGSVASLGRSLRERPMYSTNDVQYSKLADKLSHELMKIADREAKRAASKRPVVVVQTLDTVQRGLVEREYPEYDLKFANLRRPVHVELATRRVLAAEFMRDHLGRFVNSAVHVGGDVLNAVIQGDEGAHFEFDENDPVAVNCAYESSVSLMQVATASADMQKKFGMVVPESHYRKFLSGQAWKRCARASLCGVKAEGYSADLSLQAMPVKQVLAGMMQAGASVGMVALPYHPLMMQVDEAELPGLGIHYAMSEHAVTFRYPEGVAGITHFPLMAWHEWLAVNHREVRTQQGVKVYRFERKVLRGSLMFVEITEVPQSVGRPSRVMHALDLHNGAGLVKVKVWRMKGFSVDPDDPSSWEPKDCVYSESVVRKLYELGMSMPNGQFNKYALIKRASIVDARITVEGSSVSVSPALMEAEMLDLVLSIHARCYVDRYEMGKMHEGLKKNLDQVMGFARMSWGQRFLATLVTVRNGLWDSLIAGMLDSARAALDRLRVALGNLKPVDMPVFEQAPLYVTLVEENSKWLQRWRDIMERVSYVDSFVRNARGQYIVPLVETVNHVVVNPVPLHEYYSTGRIVVDVVDTNEAGPVSDLGAAATRAMMEVNDMPTRKDTAADMRYTVAKPTGSAEPERPDYNVDPDYVGTLTDIHERVFPGMALQDFSYETASLVLDPQHRNMDAKYLKMPYGASELPPDRDVYKGKIRAYNVEKRPQTTPELVGAINARNLSAPRLALIQNTQVMYPRVWENFLDMMCVPEARQMLAGYQADVVELTKQGFEEWTKKARPEALQSMVAELARLGKSFEECDVAEYLAMLKSDAKPPLSDKPLYERVEPQVIVYHDKILSSLYSSIFRVVTRRLLSLLRPEILLNLLKDRQGTRDHIQANHPWGKSGLKFLENDFSKYDKSQGEFVFGLEAYIFEQLGMHQGVLNRWMEGHRECKVRSLTMGLAVHVDYQRKSGDATTALGNGLLNVVSVAYAYRGSDIAWAVFMGDDSIVCTKGVVVTEDAVQILAEIFNLQAKFYITDAPYFASTFINLDDHNMRVSLIPDPVKLMQRWSQSVDAREPRWGERWTSAADSCGAYLCRLNHVHLARMMRERYPVPVGADVSGVADAIATAISSPERFRRLHEERITEIRA